MSWPRCSGSSVELWGARWPEQRLVGRALAGCALSFGSALGCPLAHDAETQQEGASVPPADLAGCPPEVDQVQPRDRARRRHQEIGAAGA